MYNWTLDHWLEDENDDTEWLEEEYEDYDDDQESLVLDNAESENTDISEADF